MRKIEKVIYNTEDPIYETISISDQIKFQIRGKGESIYFAVALKEKDKIREYRFFPEKDSAYITKSDMRVGNRVTIFTARSLIHNSLYDLSIRLNRLLKPEEIDSEPEEYNAEYMDGGLGSMLMLNHNNLNIVFGRTEYQGKDQFGLSIYDSNTKDTFSYNYYTLKGLEVSRGYEVNPLKHKRRVHF